MAEQHYDHVVTWARHEIGAPRDRFFGHVGGLSQGMITVCKCIHCGTLSGSRTHNLGNLDHILRGDCGRAWMHSDQQLSGK